MNTIKYIHPSSGKTRTLRIWQGSYATLLQTGMFLGRGRVIRRPSMAEADERMLREGFVRAGRRWKPRIDSRGRQSAAGNAKRARWYNFRRHYKMLRRITRWLVQHEIAQ